MDPTYGSNTYKQNNKAAETKSIGFWAGAIPQETSTKVRYVDQATGKDIVQPMEISGFGYQGFKIKGDAPTVPGYHLVSSPKFLGLPYEDGTIAPYKVGQTYDLALPDSVVIKQTVINTDGTVRATAYYKGSPVSKNASKVLGRESDNDQMSFVTPDSKFHTYTNRIGQVDDSYIYYYAKDSDPNGSEMRLHFIDVTGVNNSYYAPSDGPELVDKVQTIHGNIGDGYGFTYTVPTNYYEVGSSDVKGTYSGTHHDAYVYVKKQAENKLYAPVASDPLTVEQGTTLTTNQAKDAVKYNGDVPSDATYAWDPNTPVDTATVGSYTSNVIVTYGDHTTSSVPVTVNVVAKAESYHVTAKAPVSVDKGAKVDPGSLVNVTDPAGKPVELPAGSIDWKEGAKPDLSTSGDKTGQVEVTLPDGTKTDVPVQIHVNTDKGDTTDAGNITPTVPGDKVTVKDPSHLTDDEKNQVKNNVDNANKDKFPEGTTVTVGDDGTATIKYPDGSKDTIPGDQLVQGQKGDTTDAGNITPTVPGDKVTVKDPSHLTDSEKDQVKKNVGDANKGNFPAGTNITVGDDGTTTVTYPDGSKDTIPGRDLIIGVKAVNNQVVDANGNVLVGWKVVNGQPVKSSDQPVMTREAHKAQQAKTLPQTGEKDNKLGILGLLSVSLASLFGLGKKKKKED
ncbi:Rib/alpha-like domain-containing protein [Lactobacillus sp. UMNPBX4]|uniref:Rib/alpha-like domain-containing protein n=1 Tax=Lactobacillus sp. UMNPBX4 TaxID=2042043 RepID=UPI00117B2F19|nr:Rib/alpha-like domain-containing protein [Lactobacillus sp. UMNPBX4]